MIKSTAAQSPRTLGPLQREGNIVDCAVTITTVPQPSRREHFSANHETQNSRAKSCKVGEVMMLEKKGALIVLLCMCAIMSERRNNAVEQHIETSSR